MAINCTNHLAFLFSFLALSSVALSIIDCEYWIEVKTGSHRSAGTNSTISVILYAETDSLTIRNLAAWGERFPPGPPFRPFFQSDSDDTFVGRDRCIYNPICSVTLKSDGKGTQPGWYVEFVEVVSNYRTQKFIFNQWLSVNDPPFQLQATRGNCSFPTLSLDSVTSTYVS